MKYLILTCLTAISFHALAAEWTSFQEDALGVDEQAVYTISAFSHVDYFSTFSHRGEFLWEIPFGSTIISWRKENKHLYILSKTRNGSAYFISCIDPLCGEILWEKGIFEPIPRDQDRELGMLE